MIVYVVACVQCLCAIPGCNEFRVSRYCDTESRFEVSFLTLLFCSLLVGSELCNHRVYQKAEQ